MNFLLLLFIRFYQCFKEFCFNPCEEILSGLQDLWLRKVIEKFAVNVKEQLIHFMPFVASKFYKVFFNSHSFSFNKVEQNTINVFCDRACIGLYAMMGDKEVSKED